MEVSQPQRFKSGMVSIALTEACRFYLVLICPSVCYIAAIWFLFPETKNRTLEEIGTLFGDEHVAAQYYGISEEEKQEIARNALKSTRDRGSGAMSGGLSTEKGHVERVEDAYQAA